MKLGVDWCELAGMKTEGGYAVILLLIHSLRASSPIHAMTHIISSHEGASIAYTRSQMTLVWLARP